MAVELGRVGPMDAMRKRRKERERGGPNERGKHCDWFMVVNNKEAFTDKRPIH